MSTPQVTVTPDPNDPSRVRFRVIGLTLTWDMTRSEAVQMIQALRDELQKQSPDSR